MHCRCHDLVRGVVRLVGTVVGVVECGLDGHRHPHYGFGASFVALFMQLGGGIYTKAADVGADMVGKIEQNIPEDDPRNPATIAALVGDMVGDCVGSSADVFESVAAEIIGAMILGSTVATEAGMANDKQGIKFIFFPLVVHAMDILVSSAGIFFVGMTKDTADSDPMKALQRFVCAVFSVIEQWLERQIAALFLKLIHVNLIVIHTEDTVSRLACPLWAFSSLRTGYLVWRRLQVRHFAFSCAVWLEWVVPM